MIERRREPRVQADTSVQVWGTDARGEQFCQVAVATNLSQSGALLSGLGRDLRSGDLIGIARNGTEARFKVIWGRDSGSGQKFRVAVHKVAGDPCPWKDLLSQTRALNQKSNPNCEFYESECN
jgi:hypothetical protein